MSAGKRENPVSKVSPLACSLEELKLRSGLTGDALSPVTAAYTANMRARLEKRLRTRRMIRIIVVEWRKAIEAVEYPVNGQGYRTSDAVARNIWFYPV